MTPGALRALEFDRIVQVLSGLAVTPTGRERLAALCPLPDESAIAAALRATTEGVRFLADHPGFPLRAPADLDAILDALDVESRPLEPLHLLALAEYLDSIEQTRAAVAELDASFPALHAAGAASRSFRGETAAVRRAIAPSGDVVDEASPALASLRDRLRRHRARLRSTLEAFLRGRDTAKYLQDQVVTDRNGRFVLLVRAEHRTAIPGIVHGASASGASLFLEPLATVEINNEIVAIEEQEAEEVRRILLALTDALRDRGDDLHVTLEAATTLDAIQARARLSQLVGGIEPAIAHDGAMELAGARHPLLIPQVIARLDDGVARAVEPVPVDIRLLPPVRVLVVAGPNTGGKTVALKTAGLLAAMAQAGLHIPAEKGSRLPVFRSIFADIGDEQSIAANLSTFSGHIANIVSMDRALERPALVLLDEVGAGTDPVEGGALGIAIIDHFRRRGAHLMATTHYDALKSYASTTDGVEGAAFGFDPQTFAPTYRLVYGSPGRSLAIEIAARLGLPPAVIAEAREQLSEPEKQLAEHLARVDEDLRRLEHERRQIAGERERVADSEKQVRAREASVVAREEKVRRRLDTKLDDQLRDARRQIDAVIDGLKTRAAAMSERAAVRLRTGGSPEAGRPAHALRAAGLSTGEIGEARAEARASLEAIAARTTDRGADLSGPPGEPEGLAPPRVVPGSRVIVGALGLEGVLIDVHGNHAEVDVRGKRLRAPLGDLRAVSAASAGGHAVHVNVDLRPRDGSLSELNVIGNTVEEALDRLEKFLDQAVVGDVRELRIVHGHGTGRLRRGIAAVLKDHPLVARFESAPENQGGGGATIVVLR
jgi:DNA mismatch repair protein MutS2